MHLMNVLGSTFTVLHSMQRLILCFITQAYDPDLQPVSLASQILCVRVKCCRSHAGRRGISSWSASFAPGLGDRFLDC
ncbi:hypothetical protein DUNSADRAFT_1389 [Dunaliella salina]|uniref:Secreted protein n=1 Tax=Dunaliella salina TaxID=3046 RepID=A0ABQ7FXH9_DUNSA|nr:hypothetical protein DUNSADRAFT_1389 [Dunaliella salina]|eukprot:KAF5827069.1 hypothetical protein DUNSADRAFT_1389 [Dunaliella salina]